jgi:DNA-binding NarL/FixJ family response regulator
MEMIQHMKRTLTSCDFPFGHVREVGGTAIRERALGGKETSRDRLASPATPSSGIAAFESAPNRRTHRKVLQVLAHRTDTWFDAYASGGGGTVVRIIIADDHAMFRGAIRHVLSAETDFTVVGEASSATEAIELSNTLMPDVVLMDIGMTGISSFDATRQIKRGRPDTKVLFVSMYDDRDYVRRAMQSGASGYLLKDTPIPELVRTIRKIIAGGTHMTPRMVSRLINDLRRSDSPAPPASRN